jgi:hypothetical protein
MQAWTLCYYLSSLFHYVSTGAIEPGGPQPPNVVWQLYKPSWHSSMRRFELQMVPEARAATVSYVLYQQVQRTGHLGQAVVQVRLPMSVCVPVRGV